MSFIKVLFSKIIDFFNCTEIQKVDKEEGTHDISNNSNDNNIIYDNKLIDINRYEPSSERIYSRYL